MNVRLAVAMAMASIALGGCRSPLQKRTPARIAPLPSDVVRAPALNVEAEAEVGQTLTSSTSKRTACPAITLAGAVVHAGTGYPSPFVLTIPQGTLYAAAQDSSGTFYASAAALEFSGAIVELRGAKLQIVSATGAGITYRVLAYLEE